MREDKVILPAQGASSAAEALVAFALDDHTVRVDQTAADIAASAAGDKPALIADSILVVAVDTSVGTAGPFPGVNRVAGYKWAESEFAGAEEVKNLLSLARVVNQFPCVKVVALELPAAWLFSVPQRS